MPSDETAGNSVIGIERAEGGSELEAFKSVGGPDGDAFVLNVCVFERAVGRFHVAHVAGGKFAFER